MAIAYSAPGPDLDAIARVSRGNTIQATAWAPKDGRIGLCPLVCRVGVSSLKIGDEQVAWSLRRASCFFAGPQLALDNFAACLVLDLAYVIGGFVWTLADVVQLAATPWISEPEPRVRDAGLAPA